jgi:hypothetical protein
LPEGEYVKEHALIPFDGIFNSACSVRAVVAAFPGINLSLAVGWRTTLEVPMIQRHKRRKSLTDTEIERFASECAEAHRRLIPYMMALSPLNDDYKAVMRLSEALKTAVREVTGDVPDWCQIGPGRMPPVRSVD